MEKHFSSTRSCMHRYDRCYDVTVAVVVATTSAAAEYSTNRERRRCESYRGSSAVWALVHTVFAYVLVVRLYAYSCAPLP